MKSYLAVLLVVVGIVARAGVQFLESANLCAYSNCRRRHHHQPPHRTPRMRAWIHNGKVIFAPRQGATEVPQEKIRHVDVRTPGANEERGAIDSVSLERDGTVVIRYDVKASGNIRKAEEKLAGANTVAKLRDVLDDLIKELKRRR